LADGDADRATDALAEAMVEARRVGAVQRIIDEQHTFAAVYAEAAARAGFHATADHVVDELDRAGKPPVGT